MKRNTWIALGISTVLVAGSAAYVLTRPKDEVKWRMAKVDKGNITQRINATGAEIGATAFADLAPLPAPAG